MQQNYSIIYLIAITGIYSAAFSMENNIENLYNQAKNLESQNKISEATLLYGELIMNFLRNVSIDRTSHKTELEDATEKFNKNASNALTEFGKEEEYEKALKICNVIPAFFLGVDMSETESKLIKLLAQKKQN